MDKFIDEIIIMGTLQKKKKHFDQPPNCSPNLMNRTKIPTKPNSSWALGWSLKVDSAVIISLHVDRESGVFSLACRLEAWHGCAQKPKPCSESTQETLAARSKEGKLVWPLYAPNFIPPIWMCATLKINVSEDYQSYSCNLQKSHCFVRCPMKEESSEVID